MILGIDEVGRGPWAGPLVVGAVVLGGAVIEGLTDSKKLTKQRREELDIIIRDRASGVGLGWVSADEIDSIGLAAALVLATKRAVKQVKAPYHEIIIDGTVNFLKDTDRAKYVTTLTKADLLIPSVSAASIVAKVARDAYMVEQDMLYPGYGFVSHVGYGTAIHRAAIDLLGVTPLHRLSFTPLAKYRGGSMEVARSSVSALVPNTNTTANATETAAVFYLMRLGHDILDRNWQTKFCQIDIVSIKHKTIYFNEVKYSKNIQTSASQTVIAPTKLKAMKLAAEYYELKNKLTSLDLRLMAIVLRGEPAEVDSFLEVV